MASIPASLRDDYFKGSEQMKKIYLSLAIAAACASTTATAESAIETLMKDSTTKLDFRYRFEGVDQTGFDKNAVANTVRSRLSFTSGAISGFSFKLEFDDVRSLGTEKYNSTVNGKTEYPVIADPQVTDLNQAFVKYAYEDLSAIGGRQRIVLNDQRFVGGVAWRQNEQTFDGARFAWDNKQFAAEYSYITQVNRIFGESSANGTFEGDVHLLNTSWKINDANKIVAFYYGLDFDNSAANSSDTIGLRYEGKFKLLSVTASYATQSDAGDNPTSYTADYLLLEGKGKITEHFNWTLGYEVLGSDDGNASFSTPLATGHKFQGFADKFLSTPADGVQDIYVGAGTKIGPVKVGLTYHDFQAVEGSAKYGSEIDVVVAYPVTKNFKTLVKYANYQADEHATDTQKIWLQAQVSL